MSPLNQKTLFWRTPTEVLPGPIGGKVTGPLSSELLDATAYEQLVSEESH